MTPWLDRIAFPATLLCVVFLLHGRVFAEGLFTLVAVLFLLRSAAARDWRWLRTPWVGVAGAWWLWLVACSLGRDAGQAVAVVRFLVFVAALEHWVLVPAARRRWLARACSVAAAYIALQSAIQFATGRNIQGYGRYMDGELTGPFEHPRAAGPLSRLLFPAILPPMARWPWWGGVGLALAGVAAMVLIGQRMPLLLTILGLGVTASLLPRLRRLVIVATLAGAALLGASVVVSPPTFTRLVTKFSRQMEDFPDSAYGQIAARAVAMVRAHPATGLGFDGFRRACPDPAYFAGWHFGQGWGGDGGGAGMCVQHPHNFYLQAAVEAGLPGLALFAALALAWCAPLLRGLGRDPDPLRVGLFVAALVTLWPIASSSAFTSMPLSGWFFLLLGLGLAEARAYMNASIAARPTDA